MKIKCNTKFNIEKRYIKKVLITNNVPINMVFTYEGKRLIYYIGYRIDAKYWNHQKQCVEGKSSKEDGISDATINNHLKSLAGHMHDIYSEFKLREIPINNEILLKRLKNKIGDPEGKKSNEETFWDYYDKYLDARKSSVSDDFLQSATSTKNHLFTHLKGKNISFDDIDFQFFERFKKYYVVESENAMNSFAGVVKRFKIFLNYASKNGWNNNVKYKDYSIGEEYGPPVYLNWDEVKNLYKFKPKSMSYLHVRNLFIFQSNVGCRYEDLLILKTDSVNNGILTYFSDKSKKLIEVPLTTMAKKIIFQYKDLSNQSLLPVISNQKYNDYLKKLGKEAELNRMVEYRDRKGNMKRTPIYNLMTTHMGRRNFIGNAINKFDIRTEVIKSLTGHSQNSKAFARYFVIDIKTKVNAISLIK